MRKSHVPGATIAAGSFWFGAVTLAADEAAGHAEAAPNPMAFEIVPYIASLVVFGAAFFILSKVAWPKILGGLQEREKKIRDEIDAAERSRKQAERALQQYEKALSEARAEASKMLEAAKAEQQKLAVELRARTESEVNAMRDAAKRDIDAARRAAVAEVYANMAETATSVAARILGRELNSADQQSLVEQSLGELQSVRAN